MSPPVDDGICPFVYQNDRRCARMFTLQQLDDLFRLCLGRHSACRIYHELSIRVGEPCLQAERSCD
jgi:hypothetical protein